MEKQIKVSDRAREAQNRIQELNGELRDLNQLVLCIQALQAVEGKSDKYQYTQEEYDAVVARVHKLCAKHEIHLPDGFFEWSSIQII